MLFCSLPSNNFSGDSSCRCLLKVIFNLTSRHIKRFVPGQSQTQGLADKNRYFEIDTLCDQLPIKLSQSCSKISLFIDPSPHPSLPQHCPICAPHTYLKIERRICLFSSLLFPSFQEKYLDWFISFGFGGARVCACARVCVQA